MAGKQGKYDPPPPVESPLDDRFTKHGLIAATDLLFAYSATKFAIRGMTQSAGMCLQDFLFFKKDKKPKKTTPVACRVC